MPEYVIKIPCSVYPKALKKAYTCFLSSPFSIVTVFIVPQFLHLTLRSLTFQKA